MLKKILLLRSGFTLIFLLAVLLSMAQNGFTVSGIITDNNGKPLEGVTVHEKGGTASTATSAGGFFRINVSSGKAILQLSSVGFANQEIPVNDRAELTGSLQVLSGTMEDV